MWRSVAVSSRPSASAGARTVTVCAVFHAPAANVSVRVCRVVSVSTSAAASLLVTVTVTGPDGREVSASVYVPLVPSGTVSPVPAALTASPALSPSVTVTATADTVAPA